MGIMPIYCEKEPKPHTKSDPKDSSFQSSLSYWPLKKDSDLESHPDSTAECSLKSFLKKGGVFQSILQLSEITEPKIRLGLGDIVYPSCSGGLCRSQSLWALLQRFSNFIELRPPHAARYGWDPYNGRINRIRNYGKESMPDEFSDYFGIEKAQRFGFEHCGEWKPIEQAPTKDNLDSISQFYDRHYFGQGNIDLEKRRLYITFSNNAHVILYRLNQANETLKNVTVIGIDSDDLITSPPSALRTTSRSAMAYQYFCSLLGKLFT